MLKQKWYYVFLLMILYILIMIVACTPQELEPVPTERKPTPWPTLVKMDIVVAEPHPDFIKVIRPPEYYSVPLSLYNYHSDWLSRYRVLEYDPTNPKTFENGYQSSICVNPNMELLVQEGDLLAGGLVGDYITDRLELVVDESLVETDIIGQFGILAGKPTRVPEGPQTTYVEDVDYCWKVPLNVGLHEATFRFHQTSGDIQSYTWYFEISDS